jgi:uncharacterized membrane protein
MVTPSRTEISIPPDQSCEAKFIVTNEFNVPADIKVEAKNWFLLPDDQDVNISSWVTVLDNDLRLQPGESKEVRYQVKLSSNASGVRTAMVSFIPQTEEDQGLVLMISAAVFVTAAGTEKVNWDISDVKIEAAQDRIQVSGQVRNSGNVHLRPEGKVKIISKNKEVALLEFLEGRPVYPGKERSIVASSDGPVTLAPGKYTAIVTVKGAGEEKKSKIGFKVDRSGKIIKK